MNLGKRLIELRKENKMSQEEFAEIFNVTRQTISNYENSKSYPDIETLIKISDYFNVSLDILLKDDKKMVKEIDDKVKKNKTLKRIIVLLILGFILFYVGNFIWLNYVYYKNINTPSDHFAVHKCNFNGERIALMAKYPPFNNDKKWYESFSYDASITKPSGFIILNNTTRERKEDLMKQINVNLDDYDNAIELVDYMTNFIISIGGVCD